MMNEHPTDINPQQSEGNREEKIGIVVSQRFQAYCQREMLIFAFLPFVSWIFHIIDTTFFLTIPIVSFLLGIPFIICIHIGYIYTFRNKIIIPLRQRFSLKRKLITTWSNRLIYMALGSFDIILKCWLSAGFLEPVSLAMLIIGNTHLAYRYHKWQYEREINNKGLLLIETGILFGFFCMTFTCIIGMCMFLYWIGLKIEQLLM